MISEEHGGLSIDERSARRLASQDLTYRIARRKTGFLIGKSFRTTPSIFLQPKWFRFLRDPGNHAVLFEIDPHREFNSATECLAIVPDSGVEVRSFQRSSTERARSA